MRLATADLEGRFPGFHWSPQASGVGIPPDIAAGLEEAWAKWVGSVVLARADDAELSAYEGERRLLVVRHRRRERKIRTAKIEAVLAETAKEALCTLRASADAPTP